MCDCKVCDPAPKFVPIAGAADGSGLLASLRVLSLKECERSCATHQACKAMWFNSKSRQPSRFKLFSRKHNCKLYAGTKRTGRGRSQRDDDEGLLYDVERAVAPASSYTLLANHNNEHHNGASLLWTAVTAVTDCKSACDTTVKCTGFSVYTGVTDDQNCRLLGDDVTYGPWTPAASGPWRSGWRDSSCGGDPIVETELYRWNESVQIVTYLKSTGDDDASGTGYEPAPVPGGAIFIGETLLWLDASNEDECMQECTRQPHCTGISFELEDSADAAGVEGRRCRLNASPMDVADSWIADGTGRMRRQRRARINWMRKRRRPKLAEKDCTCRYRIPIDGKGTTTTKGSTTTTKLSSTTSVAAAATTTIAASANTQALMDEVTCVGQGVRRSPA